MEPMPGEHLHFTGGWRAVALTLAHEIRRRKSAKKVIEQPEAGA